MGVAEAGRRAVVVAVAVQRRYGAAGGGIQAAGISYYAFLSLFPLLLVGLSVVGFILAGDDRLQAEWGARLADAVPGLGPLIGENLDALVSARAASGVVGLAGLLWSGAAIVRASGDALGRIFGVEQPGGMPRTIAWAVGTTAALGLLGLAGTAAAGAAGGIGGGRGAAAIALRAAGMTAAALIDFAFFAVAYRLLVRGAGPPFRLLWPGAALAAAGWTALKLGGSWYAARTVADASAVYGTFASVIGVLVLLSLASRLLLYGAALDVVLIERARGGPMEKQGRGREAGEWTRGDGERVNGQSTAELLRSIAGDSGLLVRKEIELARHELVEGMLARVKAAAAGIFALATVIVALAFGGAAAAEALDGRMEPWASRLIVAGGFVVIAMMAALFAMVRAKRPSLVPKETRRMVKEDVAWARAQLKR